MPRVSQFYGIVITMYYNDHDPPHFHARYAEHKAEYIIQTRVLLAGGLPGRAEALVLEWATVHQSELLQNWQRARQSLPLNTISPLV